MPTNSPGCPKCHHAMELGFLVDDTQNSERQTRWMEGAPEIRRWFGGVKTQGKKQLAVTTFRCLACGYLESYADTPPTK